MAFMNKRKPNKAVLWTIIILISVGLLFSVGGWVFDSSVTTVPGGTTASSSSEAKGNQYFSQGITKLQGNDFEGAQKILKKAVTEYEKALKETPDNKLVLGDLATSYFYTGNTDKAIELVKKALEIDPNFTQARFNYAIYLGDGKNMYLDAIKELQKIKTGDPRYQDAQSLIQSYQNAIAQK